MLTSDKNIQKHFDQSPREVAGWPVHPLPTHLRWWKNRCNWPGLGLGHGTWCRNRQVCKLFRKTILQSIPVYCTKIVLSFHACPQPVCRFIKCRMRRTLQTFLRWSSSAWVKSLMQYPQVWCAKQSECTGGEPYPNQQHKGLLNVLWQDGWAFGSRAHGMHTSSSRVWPGYHILLKCRPLSRACLYRSVMVPLHVTWQKLKHWWTFRLNKHKLHYLQQELPSKQRITKGTSDGLLRLKFSTGDSAFTWQCLLYFHIFSRFFCHLLVFSHFD